MNQLYDICYLIVSLGFIGSAFGADTTLLNKQKSILPPCQSCKVLVTSFKKGMDQTARGKFEGGDAAWEEQRLLSYANSEVRLIEIQEKLCLGLDKEADQCHSLAEETEQAVEEWWFHKQKQEPDLYKYLCIDSIKACCPENHFGPDCTACPGAPDNICFNNGRCKGSGTRKGNGQCACEPGYTGDTCDRCDTNFFESYRDATKLLCSACHSACQSSCSQAGPKGCTACKIGWEMDTERGCVDINECLLRDTGCQKNQFCVNNDGSFICLACDKSCDGCSGDGPDMCNKCGPDYLLIDNMCVDARQSSRDQHVCFTRYLTYLGLCIATCIIFQKNTIAASLIGLSVAMYISISEYMLHSDTENNLGLDKFPMPLV